jgi:hypothetical protein
MNMMKNVIFRGILHVIDPAPKHWKGVPIFHYSGNEEWRINDLGFPFNKKKRLLVLHYMGSRKARKV